MQRAWEKYGSDIFNLEIILICLEKDLNSKEIEIIKQFDTLNPEKGYNLMSGGNRPNFSNETRQKISIANKGKNHWTHNKKFSQESKEKMRQFHLGENNPNYGRTGKNHWHYGKNLSEETKCKMRQSHLGENNHNYGKTMSSEQKRKISESQKIRWEKKNLMSQNANLSIAS